MKAMGGLLFSDTHTHTLCLIAREWMRTDEADHLVPLEMAFGQMKMRLLSWEG